MRTGQRYSIVIAEMSDLANVEACIEAAYRPYVEQIGVEMAPLKEDYSTLIAKGVVSIIRNTSGEFVGVLVLYAKDDHILIDNVAIMPTWQRKQILLEVGAYIISIAEEVGVSLVRAFTNVMLERNVSLYQKIGMKVDRYEDRGDRVAVHFVFDLRDLNSNSDLLASRLIKRRRNQSKIRQ